MDEPSLLRLPDLRRGRSEGRPGRRRRRGRRPPARTFDRDEAACERPGRVHGRPPPGRARAADLHPDLPLHADARPGFRRRSPARRAGTSSSRWARRTASSSPRSWAASLAELAVDGATPSAAEIEAIRDRPADPARASRRPRASSSDPAERRRKPPGIRCVSSGCARCRAYATLRRPGCRREPGGYALPRRLERRRCTGGGHDSVCPCTSASVGSRPRPATWSCSRGAAPAAAPAEPGELVLRAGTDQDLQVLNPWHSTLVVDYEAYTLNYDLLVGFGPDLKPAPGFADTWESPADGMTHTFHIRTGMKWSDGEPATCEDARWTYQLVLDGVGIRLRRPRQRTTSSRT